MTKSLDDAIKAVMDIVGDVAGIRSAPDYASDKIPPGVWAMAYPINGTFEQSPIGVLKGLHQIGLYVYAPRVDLPKTLKQVIPLGELVAGALESEPTLSGTVDTFGQISYDFNMALNIGSASAPAYATGWSFTISDVKIQDVSAIT